MAVILQLSSGSDVDLIQALAYFDQYAQPQDKVTFYILGPTLNRPQVETPADSAAITTLIDGLKRSPNLYRISDTLKQVLSDLKAADPDVPRQVLYVGSFLNDPQEITASSIFAEEHIHFNVALVQRFRPQSVAQHKSLATYGGSSPTMKPAAVSCADPEVRSAVSSLQRCS